MIVAWMHAMERIRGVRLMRGISAGRTLAGCYSESRTNGVAVRLAGNTVLLLNNPGRRRPRMLLTLRAAVAGTARRGARRLRPHALAKLP